MYLKMIKVYIGSSRDIGNVCIDYAKENMLEGYELCFDKEDCDIFISVLYDTLLKPEFIEGRRCYNFHPGVLPYYRGAGAFSWSIINEEVITGITLHVIDEDIDTGPIINVQTFVLRDLDTAESLFNKGMGCLFEMFKAWFQRILEDDGVDGYEPTDKYPLYSRKLLDERKDITRLVRAFTFKGKDCLFYYTKDGRKIELEPYE